MAAEFRFLVEDIMTGQIWLDYPADDWTYEEILNRPGGFTSKLPLRSTYADEQILDDWRRAIYVMRDGGIVWGGPLLPTGLPIGSEQLDVNGYGWLGWWDHVPIRTDYQPVGVDQFEIFQELVMDAQDEGVYGAGFDLGITVVWDALSGIERDSMEDYRPFRAKNLGEALRQLAAREDGFDYAMEYTLNNVTDRIDKAIRLYYPKKGRTTDFVFEFDGPDNPPTNITRRGFATPSTFAWAGDGWGDGSDAARLKSPYVRAEYRDKYPPYQAAPQFSGVVLQDTLDGNTADYFRRASRIRRVPLVEIDPDMDPKWGDWTLGDTVGLSINDGFGVIGADAPEPWRATARKVTSNDVYSAVFDNQDFEAA